ncbi:vitellogenic carboxypeptidase-like [Oppia nitens]|uniref:vitellogenic carboxypeptidase-like n=1 Tax=Oppia nitens TaxID=1686743 RepID=UPI0023DA2636|nr:vitellogenic carboxypeptidase-like [Oppia nitens]
MISANIYTLLLISIYVSTIYCEKQLLLTPYIKSGDIAKARSLSRVTALPNATNVESYTGFITVDEKYNSNTFFWFIPAFKNPKTAPLLVYTEGGPGGSSIMSMFMFGSFNLNDKLNVTINPFALNQEFSIIYVDNPVGTGFSYTDNPNGYSTDQKNVSKNLYEFLQQFYTVFDDYRSNDLYLGGLSYAGKFVPSFGHYLIKMSHISRVNFKGILIGNGLTDPINQLTYDKTLLNLGLIDENEDKEMQNIQNNFKGFAKSKDYRKATEVFLKLFTTGYLTNITGYLGFHDIDNSGNKLESLKYVDQYVII